MIKYKMIKFNGAFVCHFSTAAGEVGKKSSSIVALTSAEQNVSVLLQNLASGIIDPNKSAVLTKLDDTTRGYLFDKKIDFKTKILRIKNYLREPNKALMVSSLPTHESAVVRRDPLEFKALLILYALQCVLAVFPELKDTVDDLIIKISHDFRDKNKEEQKEYLDTLGKRLEMLRGANAGISSVVSAAFKV